MHITIVAKTPVAGRVKTRLCPPCTPQQAADIARAGLLDTIDAIDGAIDRAGENVVAIRHRVTRTLLLDGCTETWMPDEWRIVAQRGSGLAERLCNGFRDLGPGIVVGMETPHVAAVLPDALDHLHHGRDIIGPADDGGYWAIGLCAATAARATDVFAGVQMSTARTGLQQLGRLRAVGRSIEVIPLARDLDDYADLCAIAASGRRGRLADIARLTVESVNSETDGALGTVSVPSMLTSHDGSAPQRRAEPSH